MHPKTFDEYLQFKARGDTYVCESIVRAKHFSAPPAMVAVAESLSRTNALDTAAGQFVFPADARLPADEVCLTANFNECGLGATFFLARDDDGSEGVVVAALLNGRVLRLGSFYAGQLKMRLNREIDDAARIISEVAFILSLMNTPRLVVHEHKTLPRQQRRSMERTIGQPALGYTEVRWTIGKSIKARQSDGSPMRGMPLHWNRAHWRKANEGEPKAEWRSSGPHGAGWYCWASDYYAGHPDFGVKLQMHAPQMLGEERRPGAVAPHAALSPARLAVMNEQKRAALIAAGYGDMPQ
jgi:hypothetical protein